MAYRLGPYRMHSYQTVGFLAELLPPEDPVRQKAESVVSNSIDMLKCALDLGVKQALHGGSDASTA